MNEPLSVLVLGLSITSAWGNGHATTYRGLLRELSARGHQVTFLERDVPWYASQRDLPNPEGVATSLYSSLDDLRGSWRNAIEQADVVIVGSYVPEGRDVVKLVLELARGPVAFYDIDTPITLSALARNRCEYLDAADVRKLSTYLSFSGGAALVELARDFGAQRPVPLYCSADERVYFPDTSIVPQWSLGYLGTYSTDRQPTLEELLLVPARELPSHAFAVGGPQYPADIAWPANVTRIEHVAPPEHRRFYAQQRYTLNVTREDMRRLGWSPSIRLFEAAACGVPLVTDTWPGLEELFRYGHEILPARTAADVVRVLTELSEDERTALAERARRRVLAEHTAAHRAEQLESYLRDALDERAHPTRRPGASLPPETYGDPS